MVITPGVAFIFQYVTTLVVPSVFFGILLNNMSDRGVFGKYTFPTWLTILGSILFIPLISAIRVVYWRVDNRLQAAKLGARLPRTINGKYLGNIDVLSAIRRFRDTGYMADGFVDWVGEGDPVINLPLLWSDTIFTVWPEHIKTILATDFNNYEKGKQFQHQSFSVLGSGVFNTDGDMWKSMTRPFFARDRIRDFDIFDRHANTALSLIRERMRSGNAIDFQDLMSRFTLDSASEFLFGYCVHSLTTGIPYPHNATDIPSDVVTPQATRANEFAAAFLQVQDIIARRDIYGWTWPLLEIFEDQTKKPMKIVRDFLDPIIKEAVAKNVDTARKESKEEKTEFNVEEGETLIDHLVRLSSDPVVLRDETLNIMIAGRDTTASTLTFAVYCLAMYPAAHARLREEVLAKVGLTRRPDYDDIRDMKYLRALINETLRLFPAVPFDTRANIKATIWSSHDPNEKPIYIPAATKLIYSVFIMHRRKDLWGPDAEEFDPDRWLDDRLKKYLLKNSFIFLPFNAGPRICLGQQFAYNEISFMLIRFVQQFTSVTLEEASSPPQAKIPAHWAEGVGRKTMERVYLKSHLTMYAQGGLWVKMTGAETIA